MIRRKSALHKINSELGNAILTKRFYSLKKRLIQFYEGIFSN